MNKLLTPKKNPFFYLHKIEIRERAVLITRTYLYISYFLKLPIYNPPFALPSSSRARLASHKLSTQSSL
jgi:hypothetical protein